jgi:hypothetical protein
MVSGIVRWPGFKNRIAIPRIAMALMVSIIMIAPLL